MSGEPSPSGLSRRAVSVPASVGAALVVFAALVLSYLPSLRDLVQVWSDQPNYSHGFLVAPISALILWLRRRDLSRVVVRPSVLGWLGLVGLLAFRYWLYDRNEMWMEQATIPLAAACLVLAFGGWGLLWWAAPGLAFLAFLLPLPPKINMLAAGPLQTLATLAATTVLTLSGLPVLAEGHVIYVGQQPLEVARACSGLSMLMSFAALVTAMAIIQRERPLWERIVLLLSTIPIALLVNILRIVATGWAYHLFGHDFVEKVAHDLAGWLMMPAALGFVVLELKILSWVVVPEEIQDKAIVFLPGQTTAPRPAVKKPSAQKIDGPSQGPSGGVTD
jgi:exosortase